jgi:hypothetical protein
MPALPQPVRRTLAPTATLALLAACAGETPTAQRAGPAAPTLARSGADAPGMHRQYGPPQRMGQGFARAYVVLNARAGQAPVELGIALDEGALHGLPSGVAMDAAPLGGSHSMKHAPENIVVLRLPAQSPAPYQFAQLDWNPQGHPPAGVYGAPHFDFHFYRTPIAARDAIDPRDPQFVAKARHLPTGDFVPTDYLVPGDPAEQAVPQMGVHWFDRHAPELQGLFGGTPQPFTKTFIYGSWDGEITFYEPMVTRAYLLSRPNVDTPIPVAAQHPEPGWYPTAYRVSYDARAKEYRVALTRLVSRP